MSIKELKRAVARMVKEEELKATNRRPPSNHARIEEALRDPYLWARNYTKTYNEHWQEEGRPSPYEPFPAWEYVPDLFEFLKLERIVWLEKSRDMLVSWICVAYMTFEVMKVPACGVLFQTQKEDKVKQLVDYAKCLYEHQPGWLKQAYPLSKPMRLQSDYSLEFAHGSYIQGVPGGADQLRSYHPWGYLNDESSFQPEAGECYNEALSAVKGKIILNSSAAPGWYADARHDIVRSEEDGI